MIKTNFDLFLEIFGKFGRIKDVQIVLDKKTNKSRGFGFVYFDEIESATRVRRNLRHYQKFYFSFSFRLKKL